jgi:anaerobic magnesium-protoporphyrin IX monomethyl ester cyclase
LRKSARVLLITPNLKGMVDGLNRIQPPLGPMIMAATLRDRGHTVKIHDTALVGWDNREPLPDSKVLIGQPEDKVEEMIAAFAPDVVGVSVLFSNLMSSGHRIAAAARRARPNTVIVLGGNHVSNAVSDYLYANHARESGLPTRLLDFEDPSFDYAFWGEADFAFPEFVDRLAAGEDISEIEGLVLRRPQGGYQINPRARLDKSLSALSHPARDLVAMEDYFAIGAFHSAKSKSRRVVNVMASRGCPEHCTFCTTPEMWGSRVRWRQPEDVAAEIREAVRDFNVGEIQFEDDTLTANRRHLMALCTELERIGLPWCTPNGTKVNYHLRHQQEMYQAMAGSGCYQITLACESGVQRVLDDVLHKNLLREQIRPAIENAKNAGMFVHTFWILGTPGETYEDIAATVDFALDSGADSYSFSILSPLPGTPIYRRVVRDNLWWPGRGIDDLLFRSSLIQVDGFTSPDEFERFVYETNVRANRQLQERDPVRFQQKYGAVTDERALIKQT